jgi:plastocyanin
MVIARARITLLILTVSAAALTACTSKHTLDAGTVVVSMADNSFSPRRVRIPVGGSVLFANDGQAPHNAVAVDDSWSTATVKGNLAMMPGDMVKMTFRHPGLFRYYCTYHGTHDAMAGMVGIIAVGDTPFPSPKEAEKRQAVEHASGRVRRVPQEYPTIQGAVDAALPGDLILISPGVYSEEVVVSTPSLIIRGADRNGVIMDGQFILGNAFMVVADGVAVENMTARHYALNGFFWTGVEGYRGSYLTAYNNRQYGIYSYDSVDGVFEHSYASGSTDSGFYVGQCQPCKAILDDDIAEYDDLGYSGTNSGGDFYIVNSQFRYNVVGIGLTTFDIELLPPGRASTIVGNLVELNGSPLAPFGGGLSNMFGNGIMVSGGYDHLIERNLVRRNPNNGILITPLKDRHFWPAVANRVIDNTVVDNGRADLAIGGPGVLANCFAHNVYRTSLPWGLEVFQGCNGLRLPIAADPSAYLGVRGLLRQEQSSPNDDQKWRNRPEPSRQLNMPDSLNAPGQPALHAFENHHLNINTIPVPTPRT